MSIISIYLYIVIAFTILGSLSLGARLTKKKAAEDNNRRMDLLLENNSIMDLICNIITTEEFCKINNIVLHTNAKESYIQINEKGQYEMFTTKHLISSISFAQLILIQDMKLDYIDKKIFNQNFFFGAKSMQYYLNECINYVKSKVPADRKVTTVELRMCTLNMELFSTKYYKF